MAGVHSYVEFNDASRNAVLSARRKTAPPPRNVVLSIFSLLATFSES